jgi:4-hydroxybenzoate polyprenyltransferase
MEFVCYFCPPLSLKPKTKAFGFLIMNTSKKICFKDYLSLVNFSQTIFAIPFAIMGYFIAVQPFDMDHSWYVFVLIILCFVFARNAAISFNRVTDRFIDKRNPRNASREIPTGKIHPRNAFIFSVLNALLFVLTTFFINKLVFLLSPLAILIILGYSYTKRYTLFCHFVLGLSLSLAPIGAYLAVTGKWHILPILLSAIVFLWVSGFDILYSIQDEEFDKEEFLKSIPAVFGARKAIIISTLLHLLLIMLVIKVGFMFEAGYLYWIGSFVFIALLVTQYIIIKSKDSHSVNFAFVILNGISGLAYGVLSILSFYY